ncbi:TonB-dependent receptor [Marichromatium gracile]|uniref:Phosphate-selective porin O/P n=1 Tax=Marichromatium gracile TaxID=1048 RepID=A0A4R4AAQ7_MARGR|nr:TonB-dependent receptor [Marichromatium gracile]MBK1709128.1 porin [Marichromatium gracile]TCW36033.1 phosphate-selective porin O/P [Marichromatium gracile]
MSTPNLLRGGAGALALLLPLCATATTDDAEIAELRAMIEAMKDQYETRIQSLERRLAEAESRTPPRAALPPGDTGSRPMRAPVVHQAPTPAPTRGALSAANAFNPQISVILDGNYYHDDLDGEGSGLVGQAFQPSGGDHHDHDHAGHSHGTFDNGFNMREAELSFTATIDPYFDAAMHMAVDSDGNVELEEAYLQTRALPHGLRVKAGRFLSGFGYANAQHPHQWAFVDQNLPYLNLLGVHGLQDTGVQLTWLPALPVYTLVGVEALQGDQERFGATFGDETLEALGLDEAGDGPRLWTAFAKIAPDLGDQHALQFGVSFAHGDRQQELHAHTHDHDAEVHQTALDGDADLWGVDLVYAYDAPGYGGKGDLRLQSEYLRSIKDLDIIASAHPEQLGDRRTFTTDGLYAQLTYGIAPRWTLGLRYDVLGLTNSVGGDADADYGSSERWTLGLTWGLTEFSQLRAQYARNDILVAEDTRERFDAFYLQFLMSMGSHGAHAF